MESRDTRKTPDESESCTEVVHACDLETYKHFLEAEVNRLKQDTLWHTTSISQLERDFGSLADVRDGLEHKQEAYKSKATTMIGEKDHLISELEDKFHILEKRFHIQEHSRVSRLFEDSQMRLEDQQQCTKLEGQLLERDTELANMSRYHEEELQRQLALQDSQLEEL